MIKVFKSFCYSLITLICLFKGDFQGIDNYIISMVTNGLFQDRSFCLYINPIYNYLINAVHHAFPNTDAFTLLTQFIVFNSIWYLLYLFLKNHVSNHCVYLVIIITFFVNPYYANYTVQTAYICFIGLLSLWLCKEYNLKNKSYIFSALVLFFGSLIRKEGGALLLPFAALTIIADYFIDSKHKRNESIKICLLILSVFLISNTINGIFYNQEKYIQGKNFDHQRSAFIDYPTKRYEDISDALYTINVTENDYELIKSCNIFDTEIMDYAYLKQINNASKQETIINMTSVKSYVSDMITLCFGELVIFTIFTSLTILYCCFHRNMVGLIKIMLAVLGFSIILYYFFVKGRVVLRIVIPTYLGVIFCLYVCYYVANLKKKIICCF